MKVSRRNEVERRVAKQEMRIGVDLVLSACFVHH